MILNKNLVLFSVTNFCNARCKPCSFWKVKQFEYPKKEELESIIISLKNKLNCGFLQITGGEPLTYPYIFELIEKASKYKILTQLMTNGSLLNQTKIEHLCKVGLKAICFSIDHYDKKIVEENRGIPGLLAKIEENIKQLKNTNIIVMGGVTIARYNVNDLEKITKYVIDIGVDGVYFCLPMQATSSTYKLGTKEAGVVDISNEQMVEVIARLIKIKKSFGSSIAHNIAFLRDMQRYYSNKKQNFSCKGGERIFYLDNRLVLYKCMMKNVELGKINDRVKTLENANCYECPLQCFREPSLYLYGLTSLPFVLGLLLNKCSLKLFK